MVTKKTPPRGKSARSRKGRPISTFKITLVSAIAAFAATTAVLQTQLQDHPTVTAAVDYVRAEVAGLGLGWLLPPQEYSIPSAAALDGYVQTSFARCPDFFPQQQMPLVPAVNGLRELCFTPFAVLHNGQTKTPTFVVQRLNRQLLDKARSVARKDRFYEEARLPKAERAQLADYRNSGYSRGHMAPAADMHSKEAMAQSFSLANIVPQNQIHNSGAWARIESDTHKYVRRARGDVYVFTGPVYETAPPRIGEGGVAVPTWLFKLVYDPSTGRSWVHWHENREETLARSPISYEEFVQRTGLYLLGRP